MPNIQLYKALRRELESKNVTLVAVSKTKPIEDLKELYDAGCKIFGENKVQELIAKHEQLPKDIQWHMIGHLQRNKVKYITPFIYLIHSIDSFKLLKEVNKEAIKSNREIPCLLQIHIAQEETKFGFSLEEVQEMILSTEYKVLNNIKIAGVMGMATNTDNMDQVRKEFKTLHHIFNSLKINFDDSFKEISMGMSGDYLVAIEEGSTMVRIGSSLFGKRNYT